MFNTVRNLLPATNFLRGYVAVILVSNIAGCIWAISPDAMGIYIALFLLLPLNFLFMLFGLVSVITMQIKKYPISYMAHYCTVVLVPVAAQIILIILVDLFAPKIGC